MSVLLKFCERLIIHCEHLLLCSQPNKIMMKCVDCRQMSEEDPDKTDKEEQKSDSANADPSVKKPAA